MKYSELDKISNSINEKYANGFVDGKVYVWDFTLSDGNTCFEKFEDLYHKVSLFCLTKKDSLKKAAIYASKELASGLAVCVEMKANFIPKYEQQTDGRLYMGHIKYDCGENGYCTDFQLYQDQQMPRDEVWIFNGENHIIIKVFNFVFIEY